MLIRMPTYAEPFRCLAGDCPHSCCIGWEVVLDEERTALYETVEGRLGERLRTAMTVDAEGDVCFPLRGGRCPFLNGQNLCDIHCALGPEATSVTCQEHPRFVEDYGPFREITLSASCPEANRLLLASREPLTFREWEDCEAAEAGDEWLTWLLPLRQRMLDELSDRTRPLKARLRDILALADEVQRRLDEEQTEDIPALTAEWAPVRTGAPDGPGLFPAALEALAALEILEPDWLQLLAAAEQTGPVRGEEERLERIAAYFLFRYLLKAVNDGDLLGRVQLCVFSVLAVERLAAVCGLEEALRRFSCEIEHSDANLEALLAAFWQRETFSLERFERNCLPYKDNCA